MWWGRQNGVDLWGEPGWLSLDARSLAPLISFLESLAQGKFHVGLLVHVVN
jgi:hypothetical protein